MTKKKVIKLEENLERTFPIATQRGLDGEYLLYCNYHHHPGVVIPVQRSICKKRNCKYLEVYVQEK